MLEFDEKVVAKKIMEETPYPLKTAIAIAHNLKNTHKDLHPYVLKWINGEDCSFEFYGITLKEIMEKENCKFVHDVIRMSCILEKPQKEKEYKDMEFYWE